MKKFLTRKNLLRATATASIGIGGLALLVVTGVIPTGTVLAALAQMSLPHRVTDGWADLRPNDLSDTPENRARGRELLRAAAARHGYDNWRWYRTLEVVATDTWAEENGGWFPEQRQRFRIQHLLGTFTSRVEMLDGAASGEVWGLQSWRPYKQRPGADLELLTEPDVAITFYLPTLQYFNELPFRLLSAEIALDAGPTTLDGRLYDRVFVTWGSLDPGPEHDQYIVWIARDSGLIEKLHYTLREAAVFAPESQRELMMAAATGSMHFEDYRDVDETLFPFRQIVTLFGPEQAEEPLTDNYYHLIEVEQARYDAVPAKSLIVDSTLPAPADSKPR